MTEYVIDITVERIHHSLQNDLGDYNLFVKIDYNGNVDISEQRLGDKIRPASNIIPILIINDNIPIPSFMINMIKKLFNRAQNKTNGLGICFDHEKNITYYYHIIDSIRLLKNDIANTQTDLLNLDDYYQTIDILKNNNANTQTNLLDIL